MRRLVAVATVLIALIPNAAYAACHWGWYCKNAGNDCGFVPFCDSPDDTPPPLQGVRPNVDTGAQPVDPSSLPEQGRQPLVGAKPLSGAPTMKTDKP